MSSPFGLTSTRAEQIQFSTSFAFTKAKETDLIVFQSRIRRFNAHIDKYCAECRWLVKTMAEISKQFYVGFHLASDIGEIRLQVIQCESGFHDCHVEKAPCESYSCIRVSLTCF